MWLSTRLRFSDRAVQFVKPTVATMFAKDCVGSALDYQTPESNNCQRKRFGILGIESCLAFANCSVPWTMLTPAKNCFWMAPIDKMSRWVEARGCGYGI